MITNQDAARPGWHYDPMHCQPVYLFWGQGLWLARFVWHNPSPEAGIDSGGRFSGHDEELTHTMYERLIPLGQEAAPEYTDIGGCAIRGLYGMRKSVQVKLAASGHGVFIQAPIVSYFGQCDPMCHAVWLSDDEIPTIIRALQARRRAVLATQAQPDEPPSQRED